MITSLKSYTVKTLTKINSKLSHVDPDRYNHKKLHIPGMSSSNPIDVFNRHGKQLKSGIFIIDWDKHSSPAEK